jgi:hypothetical protein
MATMANAAAPEAVRLERVQGRQPLLPFRSDRCPPEAQTRWVRRRRQGTDAPYLDAHKKNLEAMGSSLENVIKVTAFLADVKTEKPAFNEAYAEYFKKGAPARSAFGVEFPDSATRVEIELIAWVP